MTEHETEEENDFFDEPKVYPTIGNEIFLVIRFLLYSGILGAIAIPLPKWLNMKPNKSVDAILMLVAYSIALLLTIRVGHVKYFKNTGAKLKLKFNRAPVIAIAVSICITLTMPVLSDPIGVLIPMSDYWKKFFSDMNDTNIFSILTVVVAAPVLEEMFFRGVILNGLLKNYPPQMAIIVSASIFGIAHLNPWQAIPAFLGGLLMGWMYWKTNSIIPGMILHFCNNAFSVMLGIVFKDADTIKELVSTPVYIALYLGCTAILLGGWMYLEKYFEENPTPEDEEYEPEILTVIDEE